MTLNNNYAKHKELYLLCFKDDTAEEAELLFKNVLSKAECICRYENQKPIAMLFLMESDLIFKNRSLPFYYLYAAATHPDHRGKGIMRQLLSEAKEKSKKNGKHGIFLKPATASLFDFYSLSEFKPFFKAEQACFCTKNLEIYKKDISVNNISNKKWYTLRKTFITSLSDCYADFCENLFLTATSNCFTAEYSNTYAVYEIRDDTLLVKEAVCNKNNIGNLLALCLKLADTYNLNKVEIRTPVGCGLKEFIPKYTKEVFFSVAWSNFDCLTGNHPYQGFAFD